MELKKFYVTGLTKAVTRGKRSEVVHELTQGFDRVVYSSNAQSAKEAVIENLIARRAKGTRVYDVLKLTIVAIEVFESVSEELNLEVA